MEGRQPVCQEFLALKKVMQISGGEITAGIALTIRVNRPARLFKIRISYIYPAVTRKKGTVTT
jgi:hypothetical protein